MSLTKKIMFNCMQAQWSEKKFVELKSFSNDIFETLGTLKTPVSWNDWKIQKSKITVVGDGFQPILGRDLFDQIGITISQKPCPKSEVNTVETPCAIKHSLAKKFPELIWKLENQVIILSTQNFTEIIVSHTKKEEKYQSISNRGKNRIEKIIKWRTYWKVIKLFQPDFQFPNWIPPK